MAELKLISADSHVNEPGDLWTERIDKQFRDRAPCVVETPDLAATLKRHLTLKAESPRTGNGELQWLFPTGEGALMDKDHLGGVFPRLLRRAGLPHHRAYDRRHTYASLLLADGAPLTYVSAQLGHANPTTTLRHYARWMPEKGKRRVNALDKTARGARFVEPKVEPARRRGECQDGSARECWLPGQVSNLRHPD